jgi:hypothetical protein
MAPRLASRLFAVDPHIRYVAVNRSGAITEMEQSAVWPTSNAPETDRMEELIVNPIVLEAVRRRGNLDLGGVRHVTIRYGAVYQVIVPIEDGHVSVGVDPSGDVEGVAAKVESALSTTSEPSAVERALSLALPRGLH